MSQKRRCPRIIMKKSIGSRKSAIQSTFDNSHPKISITIFLNGIYKVSRQTGILVLQVNIIINRYAGRIHFGQSTGFCSNPDHIILSVIIYVIYKIRFQLKIGIYIIIIHYVLEIIRRRIIDIYAH